jgi:hypothetical protein
MGRLAEPAFLQAHFGGNRLFFVGEHGSLSTVSSRFDDWRLLFGARGYAPQLDFDKELAVLAVSPDRRLFVAGTKTKGAALYDTEHRQWSVLPFEGSPLDDLSVEGAAIDSDHIWIGTARGFQAYSYRRRPGGVEMQPDSTWLLPASFRNLPIHHLRVVDAGKASRLEIVAGRGAHLSRNLAEASWNVQVGEGLPQLTALGGRAELSGVVPSQNISFLAVPAYGVVRYDAPTRGYGFPSEQLPGQPGSRKILQLEAPLASNRYALQAERKIGMGGGKRG